MLRNNDGRLARLQGQTSKFFIPRPLIQQKAAAFLYNKCYVNLLDATTIWLQPLVGNFDVCPKSLVSIDDIWSQCRNFVEGK